MDNWIQEMCYIFAVTSGPDRPNNFNEARNHQCQNELTMDRPAPIHLKEMYRIIRYVLETKRYGLKVYPKRCSWIIQAFGDSDFAGDKDMRRSVYGYFIYFCGIPIAWKSKGMRSAVLSTTEAEYIALSQVVKENKFIIQLMSTMNMNVEIPITI